MMSDFEVRRRLKDPLAALPYEIGTELLGALRHALELESPELFIDMAGWAQTALIFRDITPAALASSIDELHSKLPQFVRASEVERAREMLRDALVSLDVVRLAEAPAIDEQVPSGEVARRYLDAVLEGDETRGARDVLLAFAGGMKTLAIFQEVLTPVLHEVGRLWQRNEISVSQEHVVTAAVERLMAQLVDVVGAQPHRDLSVASASLGASQHEVGARMVADAFALCGWQATYLGAMVPVSDLLEYIDRVSVDVLAVSATLGRDVPPVRTLISELETRPIAPLVIVGGRAFSLHPALWRKVGADGYAHTPLMGVALANELVAHNNAR
jgi:MerR family transcriptional regulator, light-induced transcriptional regulator